MTAGLTPQVCVRLRAGGWLYATLCSLGSVWPQALTFLPGAGAHPRRELTPTPHLGVPGPRLGVAAGAYFEYSSTINCSCTGRLICWRVGTETTRPEIDEESKDSHSGIPRPFTSSMACSTVGLF